MSDEFQLRKDIDRMNFFLDNLEDKMREAGITDSNLYEFIEKVALSVTNMDNSLSNEYYRKLLEDIENYRLPTEDKYTLFRGDCWSINNNFESSASITSESLTDFSVVGTFRTKQDMIGIYWYSEDIIQHPYISYGSRTNYEGVTLEFDYSMSNCKSWTDHNVPVSLTIKLNTGEIHYVNMYEFISGSHVTISFDSLKEDKGIDINNIEYIMLLLIPSAYEKNDAVYTIMSNVDFNFTAYNIEVTNSYICDEHTPLAPHKYRLCEGYDDFYNLNPTRICKEMRKLGYSEWVDLYIGASHFYEKRGTVGDTIIIGDNSLTHARTEKMVLDPQYPLTPAFSNWLLCYATECKKNGVNNFIVSVSMENLQCPPGWRQKQCFGTTDNPEGYALTGWIPSTFFYSPCNTEVNDYMQYVSSECLDIVVSVGLKPILQMGEAWWWWNENYKPDGDAEHYQPPCFYDDATTQMYYSEFGENMPEYTTSWEAEYDSELMAWLNQKLCDYSDGLRSVVKNEEAYTDGVYMALFFPPSVMDTERVPPMMQEVNYLVNAYSPSKMDILQIEDYDWVIEESPHHSEAYEIGTELGFNKNQLHYYGGFVQYPEDAIKLWKLIKESMEVAFDKNFGEVFVWAGTQIRRDNKFIGYDDLEVITLLTDTNAIIQSLREYINKLVKGKADVTHTHSYNSLTDKPVLFNKIPDTTVAKDLDDYVNGGFYYCSDNSYAPYIAHCPLSGANNKAFYLMTEEFENHGYAKQTLTYYDTNTVYTRLLIAGSGWTDWAASGSSQHNHDDRYYTKAQVDSIVSQKEHDLLNRVSIKGETYSIARNEEVDLTVFVLDNGVPNDNKTVQFYIKED